MMGCLPQRWPIWLHPELVEMDGPPIGPFPASHPITQDGRIFMVPAPGHFRGHSAVVARGDVVTYLFAGDATYEQQDLAADRVDGVTYDPAISLATIQAIKTFARQEPTIILPATIPMGHVVSPRARYSPERTKRWSDLSREKFAGTAS
jgi:glyoxylase-like metal-dependent hydrolase (beta-lactamase superfamily II)